MITAEELVIELNDNEEKNNFKLAIVVDLFENETAKIKFDGEEDPSEKQYAYLKSYIPEIGDRIFLAAMGGTYIVLGKVNFNESPSIEEDIDRYLFDVKKVIMEKGLNVSLGLETDTITVNNGATIVGNVGVNGNVTTTGLSSTGSVTGASATINGDLGAGATSVSSLTSTGTIKGRVLESTTGMRHKGSISFFGSSMNWDKRPVSKMSTIGDTTANAVRSKLNDLIGVLNDYNLV